MILSLFTVATQYESSFLTSLGSAMLRKVKYTPAL